MDREHSPKRRKTDFARPPQFEHRYVSSTRSDTPRNARGASTPRQNELKTPEPVAGDEDEEEAMDRDWYGGDEDGGHAFGDDSHNPFGATNDAWLDQQREAALAEKKTGKRMNARQLQRQKDVDAWETNRMLGSGVAQRRDFHDDFEDDEEATRVHLLVHDLKPPFLDGKTIFTKQQDPISAVLDPQSDMAVFSRKGSAVVKEKRQQKERQKAAQEATNVAGTALGNIMGVKEDDTDSANPALDAHGKPTKNHFLDHATVENKAEKTQGQSSFSKGKSLKEQRQYLPAYAERQNLMRVIRDNQVVIVIGETGSGKTTQLTQFLYEDGYAERGIIGCTQPRRVAAMSVAKRVSEEMGVSLGTTVGYTIRFEDHTSKETKIKYMTDGILLREASSGSDLDQYSCIIMDEAHERSLNTDVLMGLFRGLLRRRPDLKLIITSATMNAERFSNFFFNAPQCRIPGRTFPVDIQYSRSPCEDYVDSAVKQALAIHVSQGPGDILIFMTGQEDIEITCELLAERLRMLNDPQKLSILPIYSQMPADLQAKIFEPAPPGVRKVVVATNIAETSLTVDGIMYVVDCGFSKLKVYNPQLRMDSLQITPISQANASQRAGRAGRTGPGRAFHLYTERAFKEEFYIQTIPEVQRTNLANTVLQLKAIGVKDLIDFDFMDPPPQEAVATSLFDLWALGALDHIGNLTDLGRKMSLFPLEPALAKLVVISAEEEYSCSQEMLTIVSMLNVPPVFSRPKERLEESDAAHEKFFVPESDHLTLLNVFSQWQANGCSDSWCVRHFLQSKSLRRAREIRDQLKDALAQHDMALKACGTDWDIIRKCICAGYYHQAARVKGIGEYINLRTNVSVQLHPTSALYGLGVLPEFVVYHELILTSKEYMSTATAVDPHWLADLGGVFYGIREKSFNAKDGRVTESSWSRKAEIEAAMKRDWATEQSRLEEERKKEEELRAGGRRGAQSLVSIGGHNKVGNGAKKVVSQGAVRRPVVKKKGPTNKGLLSFRADD